MTYQLHWQNVDDLRETIFVAQSALPADEALASFRKTIDRRKDECPKGWTPLVCNEESDYFVWAAPSPTPDSKEEK
jgi:hypothetical protein